LTPGRAAGAATFRAAAEAYDRHVGRYTDELAAALLAVAGVPAGARALDVGCGPGSLTRALARALGPERVSALDPSPPFVEACRRRVPGAEVKLGAAEDLPFADGSFDAVLSQLVLNFLTDAPAGVREMRRVARPGAVIASCVWDYADGMTLLRRFWDAAQNVDPERAAERDEGRVMRYCSPPELERLWRDAGVTEVRTGELTCSVRYEDFETLWAPYELGIAPSGAYAASLDASLRAALKEEYRRLLGGPAGSFSLSARAWFVVGRV
jgi:SAM-dependent methyltransferase